MFVQLQSILCLACIMNSFLFWKTYTLSADLRTLASPQDTLPDHVLHFMEVN